MPRASSATASSRRCDAEGARGAVGPDAPGAGPSRSLGPGDAGDDGDRFVPVDGLLDLAQLGERLARDRLDEDVEDAAAGQPDGERVVVADAVAPQRRLAGRRRRPAPPRRPRPRRSRRRRCPPPSRRGRRASRRRPAAARSARWPPPCPRRRSPPPATSRPVRRGRHARCDHLLRQLLERGHAVPGDEVVDRGQRRLHARGERLVARPSLVRVDPHHRVRQPPQPRHLLGEHVGAAALPAVAAHDDDGAAGGAALPPAVEEGLEHLAEPGAARPVRDRASRRRPARARGRAAAAPGSPASAGCRR